MNKVSNAQVYYAFDDIINESNIIKNIKQRAARAARKRLGNWV